MLSSLNFFTSTKPDLSTKKHKHTNSNHFQLNSRNEVKKMNVDVVYEIAICRKCSVCFHGNGCIFLKKD